jgi:signal transduction histidine kinase/CheY-like chemotaxis protein
VTVEASAEVALLRQRVAFLENENATLADGHEGAVLFGLLTEGTLGDSEAAPVLRGALERISLLIDIPRSACLALEGDQAIPVECYDTRERAWPAPARQALTRDLLERLPSGPQLLRGEACEAAGLAVFPAAAGPARAVLLVGFQSRAIPRGLFLLADDRGAARLEQNAAFMPRLCQALVARLDHVTLLGELRELAATLERRVGERTRDLEAQNQQLALEIAERERSQAALRQSEEALRQAQKLESVGRLAGGVAHDFNNLLTVILSGVEELRRSLTEDPSGCWDVVDEIRAAGERARDLTRQLLSFARRQVVDPVALNLNVVVRNCERLLRRVLAEDIRLQVREHPELWAVRSDPGQLEQVLVNLAVNARDAMPRGGTLAIETRNVAGGEAAAAGVRGEWVCLTVRDSGSGMSPEVMAHLFEPFFTTKEPGKGTGLGLATVHGIVTQAGGRVEVESRPGLGSTFTVWLPRSHQAPGAAAAATAIGDRPGTEGVLVIEDDPLVRAVVVRGLRSAGYLVLVATNGAEGLEVGRQALDRIQLVVTDVVMPNLGGRSAVEALRRLKPSLRALFVSGYSQDAFEAYDAGVEGLQLLPKPFTRSALLARVRQILDRPA